MMGDDTLYASTPLPQPFPPTSPEPEEPFFLTVHPLVTPHTHPTWIITSDLPSIAEQDMKIRSEVVLWRDIDSDTRCVADGTITALVAVQRQWTILKVVERGERTPSLLCVPTYWVDTHSAPWLQLCLARRRSAWKIPYTEKYLNILLRSEILSRPTRAIARGPSLSLPDIRTLDMGAPN